METVDDWFAVVRDEELSRGRAGRRQAWQRKQIQKHLQNLDHRHYLFWKRETEDSGYEPCLPGDEYDLISKFEHVRNEPRAGMTTFKLWLPLLYCSDDPELALGPRPIRVIPIHLRYPGHPPPHSRGRVPRLGEAPYWGFVDWSPDVVLLGCNTDSFPPPPPLDDAPVKIFLDGYYGLMEYTLVPGYFDRHAPWLSYIPLDHDLFRQPLSHERRREFWTPVTRIFQEDGPQGRLHESAVNRQTVLSSIFDPIRSLRSSLVQRAEHEFPHILKRRNHLNRDVSEIDLPRRAIRTSTQALGHLVKGVQGWEEFVIVFRALERALLELTAFISWTNDVKDYPSPNTKRNNRRLRGSVFKASDFEIFLGFAHMRMPVFIMDKTGDNPDHFLKKYEYRMPPCLVDGEYFYGPGNLLLLLCCIPANFHTSH